MFLFRLTPAERRAFVGLAKHLITADARERPDETRALHAIEDELGIPVAELPPTPPHPQVLRCFVSAAARGIVVLELIALAYCDGEPHPEEMELLKAVAGGFGISELRLLGMEDWVVRQMSLSAEAEAFLRAEVRDA